MSLVPDYDSSASSSSSSDNEEVPIETERAPQQAAVKLPPPSFLGGGDSNIPSASVFKNAFTEAENAKEAILQKHVKMVDSKDNVIVINGKKICWNYRKGRCRFGHNCRYAHDSDLQKTKEQVEMEKQMQQSVICSKQILPQPSAQEMEKIREEAISQNAQTRKKRPGLTQGLVPGKKVMKKYESQKLK